MDRNSSEFLHADFPLANNLLAYFPLTFQLANFSFADSPLGAFHETRKNSFKTKTHRQR